ncbi:MAG: DOPA 4,5-dioxygenase family protein [Comamonadaceae bacterium]
MVTFQTDNPHIRGFHAHVYFSQSNVDQARHLCETAVKLFDVKMGRVHERPVGPHPDWSCQLTFKPETFGQLVPWLAMNRSGLVVFVHPISDNDLLDHVERAMWMGALRPLDLSMLDAGPGEYDL